MQSRVRKYRGLAESGESGSLAVKKSWLAEGAALKGQLAKG
jgi:hypothetical protein